MSYVEDARRASIAHAETTMAQLNIVSGTVVDNDDPQQNERLRVVCPVLGDDTNPKTMNLTNIPWARKCSILAGVLSQGFSGVSSRVTGQVSYGWAGVPKVGAEVIIAIIDGDPSSRVWLGCVTQRGSTSALPHGRYVSDGGYPEGPVTTDGEPINPLYKSLEQSFSGPYGAKKESFEWFSRACDYSAGAHVGESKLDKQPTDDSVNKTIVEGDGNKIEYTQGYGKDRVGQQPEVVNDPNKSSDPQVYGLTTPGQHALSFDDRAENCRIRLRTTTGHQVLLDDTNERIYISTTKGNNWVEMDSCGNVDLFSSMRVSLHAAKDVNITAGESIRMSAKDFHLRTSNETRIFSHKDIHIRTNDNLRVNVTKDAKIEVHQNLDLTVTRDVKFKFDAKFDTLVASDIKLTSQKAIHTKANDTIYQTAGKNFEVNAAVNIVHTATKIYDNSGSASAKLADAAEAAILSDALAAYHTNRIPYREPWPRVMTDKEISDNDGETGASPIDFTSGKLGTMEFKDYNDPNIGQADWGTSLKRNSKWHR